MNTQHTPGQLDVVVGPEIVTIGIHGKGAVAMIAAEIATMGETNRAGGLILNPDIAIANAERLALCWNSHDALVSALYGILDLPMDDSGERIIPSGFLDEARAALAIAKGGKV